MVICKWKAQETESGNTISPSWAPITQPQMNLSWGNGKAGATGSSCSYGLPMKSYGRKGTEVGLDDPWLDLMIFMVFSNLSKSMIWGQLIKKKEKRARREKCTEPQSAVCGHHFASVTYHPSLYSQVSSTGIPAAQDLNNSAQSAGQMRLKKPGFCLFTANIHQTMTFFKMITESLPRFFPQMSSLS